MFLKIEILVKFYPYISCRISLWYILIMFFCREIFLNLSRCDLVLISINSVLSGFNLSLLAIIQSETSCKHCWTSDSDISGSVLERERYISVSSAYIWWQMLCLLITLLGGVVYRVNKRGPMTEPLGTP